MYYQTSSKNLLIEESPIVGKLLVKQCYIWKWVLETCIIWVICCAYQVKMCLCVLKLIQIKDLISKCSVTPRYTTRYTMILVWKRKPHSVSDSIQLIICCQSKKNMNFMSQYHVSISFSWFFFLSLAIIRPMTAC